MYVLLLVVSINTLFMALVLQRHLPHCLIYREMVLLQRNINRIDKTRVIAYCNGVTYAAVSPPSTKNSEPVT